jgi:hypothetical protein
VLAYMLRSFLGVALNEAGDVVVRIVAQRTVAAFTERTFAHLHRMNAPFHTRREFSANRAATADNGVSGRLRTCKQERTVHVSDLTEPASWKT